MRAMDISTARQSGLFDVSECSGGGQLNLVWRMALLVDVSDPHLRSFCVAPAGYVRVFITYHCDLHSRRVSVSWEARNPLGDIVFRSGPQPFSYVLVPHSSAGEQRLINLLHVKRALCAAASRNQAA